MTASPEIPDRGDISEAPSLPFSPTAGMKTLNCQVKLPNMIDIPDSLTASLNQ